MRDETQRDEATSATSGSDHRFNFLASASGTPAAMKAFVIAIASATGVDLHDEMEVETEEVAGGVIIRKTWVDSRGRDEALRVLGELATGHPDVLIVFIGTGTHEDYGLGRVLLGAETLGETKADGVEVRQLLAEGDFNEALRSLRDGMFVEILEGERRVLDAASGTAPTTPGR